MKRNHLHSPSPLSALLICRILSHDINCFVLLPSLFGRSWILSGSDVYLLDHLPHLEPQVLFCSMSTSFLFFNLFCIDSLWIIHCLSSCWLFIHSSSLVSETSSLLRAPIGAFPLYWGLFLQAFFLFLNIVFFVSGYHRISGACLALHLFLSAEMSLQVWLRP